MKILSMPAGGSPSYDPTGLTTPGDRVFITSGGFYVQGSTVYIDITLQARMNLTRGNDLVYGLPTAASAGSSPYYEIITANDMAVYQTTGGTAAGISDWNPISAGTYVRLITSYTKA